jgi:hypothetical protein
MELLKLEKERLLADASKIEDELRRAINAKDTVIEKTEIQVTMKDRECTRFQQDADTFKKEADKWRTVYEKLEEEIDRQAEADME